jgi:lysophospholipase L1-like esterase
MRTAVLLALSVAVLSSCTRKDSSAIDPPTLVPTAAAASPPPPIASDASAPHVRFVGRFVKQPDGGMRFAWPGSAMIARFKGTGVSLRLKDEGWNLFQVVVDGEPRKVLVTNTKKDVWPLVDGLPDGVHTIAVHRRTEAKVGDAVFYGFELVGAGALLPPPPAPERRIEIVGDSISNGYGNEGPNATCGYVNSQQNEYLAYGAITARALDADHTTIAWSGKTIYEMFEYFPRALPAQPDSTWDFASWQPQAVVINVGTNNFMNVDPGEARFVQRYVELVARVRKAYPAAFIVCALGSMLSNVYPEGRNALTQARKYMKVAMQKMKDSGETNIEMLEFPEQNHADGLGCGFHPSLKTHRLMAERLTAFLKERLAW